MFQVHALYYVQNLFLTIVLKVEVSYKKQKMFTLNVFTSILCKIFSNLKNISEKVGSRLF